MNWRRSGNILAISVALLFSAPALVQSQETRSQKSDAQNHPSGLVANRPAADHSADEAAIKIVFAEFDEAFNRHDAAALSMTFAEDSDFTNMRGNYRQGRKGVEEWLAPLFRGTLKTAQRTDTVKRIRFFSPQVASVDADTVIIGTKAANGSDVPPRKGLMTVIMSKQNGRWRIAVFHEVEFPPARSAAPAS